MSQLGTVYATKRRRRNGKSLKPPPKDGVTKSNPSKRHRERLNAELDLLASLLPFEQNILSKLDRLSILRLSVSYLRTKSYFQVVMHKDKEENGILPHIHAHDGYRTRELGAFEHGLLDGDMFLQALNGFLMILTCEGEVFFATHSIESYLGFHQSDIVHQSVYELVHSEDREELQRQLLWNSFLPADMSSMQLSETLAPDKALYLERSFTVRFRCLLDNTSGFLRLDIRGRIKILHGQNRKTEEPPLALFAYCTPFGPPSLLEIPHKENMFKSKHKLDFSLVSMDQRGKHALGYSDAELVNMGGYDLVHYDDLAYVASAHQELLKTGASGMIAYRYQKKSGEWQWLQTSSRLVYKNSKPDFVICTHRQLMDEEGHDLMGKRTMDFKVSYLDTGLASTYFSEADQLVVPPSGSPNSLPPPVTPTRPNRRYKTQLRDFLSTCRTKRKMQQQQPQQTSPLGQVTSPAPVVEYLPDPAVAVAAAYSNLNPMYTTSPYATAADNIYMGTSVHSTNFYPVTENLFHQYRLQGVGGYYTDYHHSGAPASAYVTNGFLPYDGYAIAPKDDKWQDTGKYYASGYSSGYGSPTSTPQQVSSLKTPKSSPHVMEVVSCSPDGASPVGSSAAVAAAASANVSTTANNNQNSTSNGGSGNSIITPKVELTPQDPYERQTVLMWGTQSSGPVPINSISGVSSSRHQHNNAGGANAAERSPQNTPLSNGLSYNNNENETPTTKWNGVSGAIKDSGKNAPTPDSYQLQHDDSGLYSSSSHTTSPQQQHQQQQQQRLSSGNNSGGTSSSNSVVPHNSVAEQHSNSSATSTTAHHHSHSQHNTATDSASLLHATHHCTAAAATHMHHAAALHHHHGGGGGGGTVAATLPSSPQHHHHPAHHHAAAAHHHHPHQHSHHHPAGTPSHHHHHPPPPPPPPPPAPHHHHHHPSNGSEIILSQQQQQQQQLQQLSYSSQLQPLPGCTSTASSSSSPSCNSPPNPAAVSNNQLSSIDIDGNIINGTSNSNGAQYHQLAIIASATPIVLTSTTAAAALINDGGCDAANSIPLTTTALQPIINTISGRSSNSRARGAASGAGGGGGGGHSLSTHNHQQHQQQHSHHNHSHHHHHLLHATTANITAHTALAYAPNAYVIHGGGAAINSVHGGNGGNITAALIEQQPDGSPLLSFSEVTNTLLNQ